MRKITALAPANIAFIKYWGKTDEKTRIPQNDSISMCLSDLYSICTVSFEKSLVTDKIEFVDEQVVTQHEIQRIRAVLDRVRKQSGTSAYAHVKTKNNFPKATGIASSASGFAALSLSALTSAGVTLNEKNLSIFARQASGTACRSIPDGFVQWEKGTNSQDSFAYSLHKPDYWNILDIVVIVSKKMKKVSSTEGHALAPTSPFYTARFIGMEKKVNTIKQAMEEKNFTSFGRILEEDALNMHAVCITSTPSLLYWEPLTIQIMKQIIAWREEGLESYFTIDAGPSVHIICQEKDEEELVRRLHTIENIEKISINNPASGAHLINDHLF